MTIHSRLMGQFVPYVKENVSPTFWSRVGHNRPMATWLDEAQFNDALCARVQRLRIERDWTQQQMASAIGVPFERYKKYETRSPLPAYLLPRFAQVVDRDVAFLITGQDTVARVPHEAPLRRRQRGRGRDRAGSRAESGAH